MRRCWAVAAVTAVLVAVAAAPAQAADTVRQAQWYLNALQVPAAQQITRGDGVIVGVVDGVGVDASHPDLAGQILPGAGFGAGASSNGWSSAQDAEHATAMAGIIAAKGGGPNNALGIAPGAKILPVAAGGSKHDPADVASAVTWAVDHGAKVINLSLGGPGPVPPEEARAVAYALGHDAVVVASVGNVSEGGVHVGAPANAPGVVAVSGVNKDAGFWAGSAYGPETVIAAPAVQIVSTSPRSASSSGYLLADGTSAAAAIVSGTAALIRAKYPKLTAANVINRLIRTAKDQGQPGRDDLYGYGTVRILDALTKDVPEVNANPLGTPPAASSQPSTQVPQSSGSSSGRIILAGTGLGALVLVGLIVVIILAVRRRRRLRPGREYPPQPWASPMYPPSQPPSYPQASSPVRRDPGNPPS